jgi:hypothetical protein
LWNHQKDRSAVERHFNREPAAVFVAPALAIPALAWLMYWFS